MNGAPRYRLSMLCLCFAGLFNFQFWGITSFSISSMKEHEGYTTSQIGLMLPALSIATVPTQILVGSFGPRMPQRLLLAVGCALVGGGSALIWAIPSLGAVYAGYAVCGIGYGIMNTVPYLQLGLIVPRSRFALWYGLHEACAGMLSPALARAQTLGFTLALEGSSWGWRLPWVIISCASAVSTLLMLFVFNPVKPPETAEDTTAKADNWQWLREERSVWCHPISIWLLPAIGVNAFAFNTYAVWGISVAESRYPMSRATVSLTMGAVTSVAYPLAVLATALMIRFVNGRFERGARWSAVFVLGATGAAVGVASSTNAFIGYAIAFSIYASCAYHPWAYYKVLPVLLMLPAKQTSILLSRFGLVYTVCGNIIGVYTSGVLIETLGIDAFLWVLVAVVATAAALWCVPSVWAWTNSGPVPRLIALREEREKEVAAAAWRRMRLAFSLASSLGDGAAPVSPPLAAEEEEELAALRWSRWRIVPLLITAVNGDGFFAAGAREGLTAGLIEDEQEAAAKKATAGGTSAALQAAAKPGPRPVVVANGTAMETAVADATQRL